MFGAGTYSLGADVPLSGPVTISDATVQAGKIEGSSLNLYVYNPGCCSPGRLELTGSGISTISAINLNDGYLVSAGEIDVPSSFVAGNNGSLGGAGKTVIESSASGGIGGNLSLVKQTLVNEASLTVPQGSGIGGSEGARIENHGTLTMNGDEPGPTGLQAYAGGATLVNTGTLQKTEGSDDRTARSGKQNADHEVQIQDHRRTGKRRRSPQTRVEIRIRRAREPYERNGP